MQPVVDERVPRAIVHVVRGRVPPVQVELSVAEAEYLGEGVVPAVEEREEDHELHERAGHDANRDQVHICLPRHVLDLEAAEDGHTEAVEQTVGVDDRADDLGKVGGHQAPVGRPRSRVGVPVDERGREHEVQVFGEVGASVRFRSSAVILVKKKST